MMAKPIADGDTRQCGFESFANSESVRCGAPAVIIVGRTPLCKAHARYVLSVQDDIVCKTPSGNDHFVNCTKSRFMKENGLWEGRG